MFEGSNILFMALVHFIYWSQGVSGRSQRNGSSGPGSRVFEIAPFLGNLPFITLLKPNGDILRQYFLAEQLSHPLSGTGRQEDPLG